MKQLKLISKEKNEFVLDYGEIVQTEVTLVMTIPNRDAKMILHNSNYFGIKSSTAKRYTLEANEFGQAFLSTDLFGDSDIVRNKTIWVRKSTEEYPVTIIVQNQKNQSNRFIFENVIFFARNTTIKFENPPEEITVINSILSNLLAENANLAIVHSQINTLKIKTDAKLKRFKNSEITGIETMF